MKRAVLICVLITISICLWAGAKKPRASKRPAWVDDPSQLYQPEKYLSTVGIGTSRSDAEENASANLAAILLTEVTASGEEVDRYLQITSGGQTQTSSVSQVSTSIRAQVDQALVKLKFGKSWKDEQARHYTVAYLERTETADIYLGMLADNNARVMSYLRAVLDVTDPWKYHAWLNAAWTIDQHSAALLSQLAVIAPKERSAYQAPYDSEVLKFQATDAARKLQFRFELKTPEAEELRPTLETLLISMGFVIDPYAANLLSCELKLEPVDQLSEQKFFRYLLSLAIIDKDGTQIIGYSDSGQEGHLIESQARAGAVSTAAAKLETEFRKKLLDYIDSLARR